MMSFADRLARLRAERGFDSTELSRHIASTDRGSLCNSDPSILPPPAEDAGGASLHVSEQRTYNVNRNAESSSELSHSWDEVRPPDHIAAPSAPAITSPSYYSSMPESAAADSYCTGVLSAYSGSAITALTPLQKDSNDIGKRSSDAVFDFIPAEFPLHFSLISECRIAQRESSVLLGHLPLVRPEVCEGRSPYRAALLQNAYDLLQNHQDDLISKGSQLCCLRTDVLEELHKMQS